MLREGQVIAEQYEVISLEGSGGRNAVYKALDLKTGQLLAIRCPKENDIPDERMLKLRCSLAHKGIPKLLKLLLVGSQLVFIEEFVEGKSLYELQKESISQNGTTLKLRETRRILLEILDILEYLHGLENPIIYQDLKPSNVFMRMDGNVSLIDMDSVFAGSKGMKGEGETMFLGTPGFAAPEQFGGSISPATDIYAFGALMHFMITGREPIEHPFYFPPVLNCRYRPDFEGILWKRGEAASLDRIIAGCTAFDSGKRYQDAGRVRAALKRRWRRSFILFLFLLILVISMTGLCRGRGKKLTYDDILKNALVAENGEKEALLIKAVGMDASREDAYIRLLDFYTRDQFFSSGEEEKIKNLLYTKDKDSERDHLSFLRENESGYIYFCYEMGIAEYFFYEGTGDRVRAEDFLKAASEGEDYENARLLYEIGSFYRKQMKSQIVGENLTDTDGLKEEAEKFLKMTSSGNEHLNLKIYHEIMLIIIDFKSELGKVWCDQVIKSIGESPELYSDEEIAADIRKMISEYKEEQW